MQSKLILSFLAATSLNVIVQTANADSGAKVFKTFDGAAVYCNSSYQSNYGPGSKNVLVELAGEKSSARNHEVSLKITLVKCDGSQWRVDQNPSLEIYTAPNGANVQVQYSDFEALVVGPDYQVLSAQKLNNLSYQGVEQASALLNKSTEKRQDLEVIVRATKSVKSSDGFVSTSSENFGSFRLRINN